MVELAGSNHGRAIRRLRHGFYDPRRRFHHESGFRSAELSGLPFNHVHHGDPVFYQQHADKVDCQFQFGGVDVQHHRLVHCHRHDPCSKYKGRSGDAKVQAGE